MSSEQLLVLVLLAAAYAAGWFARGGRPVEGDEAAEGGDGAAAPGAGGEPEPLVAEADQALARALTAARAARAIANAPGGGEVNAAAIRAALGVLDQRVTELEACADRLEDDRGPDDEAFVAFDRAVNCVVTLRRRVDGDAALQEFELARADWERASR